MDIFTPTEISAEEKIRRGANTLIQFNNDALENMIINRNQTFNLFWNNADATPQELCDLFGNQAYKLFQSYGAVNQLIKALKPDDVPPSSLNEFTINEDGTVTIIPNPEPVIEEPVIEPIIEE